jgi:hypothetical protein
MDYQGAFTTIKEFYDHAWSGLLTCVTIIFGLAAVFIGLVGTVIPIIANHFQSKSLKDRLKSLEEEYKRQRENVECVSIETKIATGNIYMQQGFIHFTYAQDNMPGLYSFYLKALNCFLDASDKECIDKAYKQIETLDKGYVLPNSLKCYPELNDIYIQVMEKLEKNKCITNRYFEIIRCLKHIFENNPQNNSQENGHNNKPGTTDNK